MVPSRQHNGHDTPADPLNLMVLIWQHNDHGTFESSNLVTPSRQHNGHDILNLIVLNAQVPLNL
ncbi:hypothetical protein E2C01_033800 [Portunus trituberculatus]|uniref:Uncharacterized protein n=1 Tax=Portunus trituberculatus TaxID=210409 RepID=A0A5B7F6M5_PORTR|nr:hypothetical protein [Portunus trituberculatus]